MDCSTYYNWESTVKDASGIFLSCLNDPINIGKCKSNTCADATPNGAIISNTDALCNDKHLITLTGVQA